MKRKIKFIWDFRGEYVAETAKHHAIHLTEFCTLKGISPISIGHELNFEYHAIAFMICFEDDLPVIKNQLKPHRAQLV